MLNSITSLKNKSLLRDFIRSQYKNQKTKDILEAVDLVLEDTIFQVCENISWNPTAENIAEINIMVWKKAKIEIDKILQHKIQSSEIVIEPRSYTKEDSIEISVERLDMRDFKSNEGKS
jgi:hypothetical protein